MESIESALAAMLPCFAERGPERVGLLAAQGRYLATDLMAVRDLPGFDNSAMDGYALQHGEALAVGALLRVRGEAAAGGQPEALVPGTAMRIFTGAPLPAGADTVLIQENAEVVEDAEGRAIRVTSAPRGRGEHVRRRGSDVAQGSALLARGSHLGPGEIALLAAQGVATVDVHRRPTVAIVTTGDELRELGEALEPGSLVNSNAYALAAQVADAGGEPWVLPRAVDDVDAIAERLEQAARADVIVTAGGVSVGDYDLVGAAFARVGIERHFWKVAMKPGKPVLFGTLGKTPVCGLPGNPVSAMVTFELFVRPGLLAMQGCLSPHRARQVVALAHPHRHSTGRIELARARLDWSSAPPRATLYGQQGSGSMRSMAEVHALVFLPADQAEFPAGAPLQAIILPSGAQTASTSAGVPLSGTTA